MGDEGLTPEEAMMREMDTRLVRALEARPAVTVPEGFAARVAQRLPERSPAARRVSARRFAGGRPILLTPRHNGRNAMVVCMVVLAVALLALTLMRAQSTMIGLVCESIVCVQFVALSMWLGMRRPDVR